MLIANKNDTLRERIMHRILIMLKCSVMLIKRYRSLTQNTIGIVTGMEKHILTIFTCTMFT